MEATPSPRASFLLLGAGLLVGIALGSVVFFGIPTWPGSPTAAESDALTATGPGGLPAPAPVVGAPAPDFTLTNLSDDSVQLSSLKGQVVFLNFWATWCGPCRVEMPAIEQRYEALQDKGLVVLAVNFYEDRATVAPFVEQFALKFPVLLDTAGTVNELYRVRGYPTTFIIDREGIVSRLHIGTMSETQIDGYLEGLGLTQDQ